MNEKAEVLKLKIDKYRLDEEWVNQPKMFHVWAVKTADAGKRVDESKARLELTRAGLDRKIRNDPRAYDIDKVTEKGIEATILMDESYRDDMQILIDRRHDLKILEAAVAALEQRKRALEKLVDLHGRDYFAEPRASSESRDKVEETTKRTVRGGGRERKTK